MIEELELIVTDHTVQVWHRLRQFLTFAIDDDGRFVLRLYRPEAITLVDHEPLNGHLRKLDVIAVTPEEETSMALPAPKHKRSDVHRASRAVRRNTDGGADNISERQRDKVLNALLDSLLDDPQQSKTAQASETRRIASKFGEPLFAVAGVRAALTKGSYGEPAKLLAARRRFRSKLEK